MAGIWRNCGELGHVALDVENKLYCSVWPGTRITPLNPKGKILPTVAESNTFEKDMIAEAEEFIDVPGARPEVKLSVVNFDGEREPMAELTSIPLIAPVPKKPDLRIELAFTQSEFDRMIAQAEKLNQGVERGSVFYSAVSFKAFGYKSINCLTGVADVLEGTVYYSDSLRRVGMVPTEFADELEDRKKLIAKALADQERITSSKRA